MTKFFKLLTAFFVAIVVVVVIGIFVSDIKPQQKIVSYKVDNISNN